MLLLQGLDSVCPFPSRTSLDLLLSQESQLCLRWQRWWLQPMWEISFPFLYSSLLLEIILLHYFNSHLQLTYFHVSNWIPMNWWRRFADKFDLHPTNISISVCNAQGLLREVNRYLPRWVNPPPPLLLSSICSLLWIRLSFSISSGKCLSQ